MFKKLLCESVPFHQRLTRHIVNDKYDTVDVLMANAIAYVKNALVCPKETLT